MPNPISGKVVSRLLTQAGLKSPLRSTELARHQPHPALLHDLSPSPNRGLDIKMNDFFKAEILAARNLIGVSPEPIQTVVFGPNQFADFPLIDFLQEGTVFGLDIDLPSMEKAKANLAESIGQRLFTLNIDASLIANEIVDALIEVVKMHECLSDNLLQDIKELFDFHVVRRELPIEDESVDMCVSISCGNPFFSHVLNIFLQRILWSKFGQRHSWAFFTEEIKHEGKNIPRGLVLEKSFIRLANLFSLTHLMEMRRITRPGGIIYLADHAFELYNLNTSGHFRAYTSDVRTLGAWSFDVNAESPNPSTMVQVGAKAEDIKITGKDSWQHRISSFDNLEVVDQYSSWGIQRVGLGAPGYEAIYFLDSAFVLRSV